MAAAAQPDYAQMRRPELFGLCVERGFQGVARRTKRELASLLQSADRELADLRWRRRRQQQRQQEEQRQMIAADAVVADLRSAESKQPLTIANHILKALMHGFPQYPILTATLFASLGVSKVETAHGASESCPTATQAHPTFTVYPFIPLNEASGPHYKRHD